MDKCLGIITTLERDSNFGGICKNRPSYMLPFGGRYRLIDFTISNMVNHGLRTIAVYTGEKIRSTMDHLGDGKPWDLNRRINGLFLYPPINDNHVGTHFGDIAQFYSTMEFFDRTREEYIFLSNPNIIAKLNIGDAFRFFIDTGADITLIYREQLDPDGNLINCDKIHVGEDNVFENLGVNLSTEKRFNHYIGMAFVKKDIFIKILKDSIEQGNTNYFKDAIILYKDKYKINTYEFKGHVETIRDLKSFYKANLNLLSKDISRELFFQGGAIYTKSKDEPSTLYTESSNVQNSLIANGCVIEGDVENSIVFRGVKIGKGAFIKNSVVMQKSVIEENAIVVNAVLDKQTFIGKGVNIGGSILAPYVVEKYQRIVKE
ncbi:MAG: glucose-1-phosphate adenylyltransferase subunit GlgD [Tissierellaceae bacterium]